MKILITRYKIKDMSIIFASDKDSALKSVMCLFKWSFTYADRHFISIISLLI